MFSSVAFSTKTARKQRTDAFQSAIMGLCMFAMIMHINAALMEHCAIIYFKHLKDRCDVSKEAFL